VGDLSRRTEQQASSLEQTAAALDELTATVKKSAEGAAQARDAVVSAQADAEKSGQVVQDAVAAMGGIEQSAKEISQIIGVIDEIAFQTNLLALNAGVEAARAGDAGRGFAVVASEVRALAQRSAEAAKEIKTLIATSTHQVTTGVALVGEAGRALSRIAGRVTEMNSVIRDIASSAQEQATGLSEVNTAINQMDQMTQQNAAMVEETSAASQTLVHEGQELARLISRFNVGASRSSSAAPQTMARVASRGRTAVALAASPSSAAESWEEF
jgi:methyl-accepting chemotaxis protein